jgi:hypothetical protein
MTIHLGSFIKQIAQHGHQIGVIVCACLCAKYGRKVRLKVGDIEAEAQTEKQVRNLLILADEFQQRKSKVIHVP